MHAFTTHPHCLDESDMAACRMTIHPALYRKRLGALTQIYLELSLPPQVALRAAEADLSQLAGSTLRNAPAV
jgi:hypothetical protein